MGRGFHAPEGHGEIVLLVGEGLGEVLQIVGGDPGNGEEIGGRATRAEGGLLGGFWRVDLAFDGDGARGDAEDAIG